MQQLTCKEQEVSRLRRVIVSVVLIVQPCLKLTKVPGMFARCLAALCTPRLSLLLISSWFCLFLFSVAAQLGEEQMLRPPLANQGKEAKYATTLQEECTPVIDCHVHRFGTSIRLLGL